MQLRQRVKPVKLKREQGGLQKGDVDRGDIWKYQEASGTCWN